MGHLSQPGRGWQRGWAGEGREAGRALGGGTSSSERERYPIKINKFVLGQEPCLNQNNVSNQTLRSLIHSGSKHMTSQKMEGFAVKGCSPCAMRPRGEKGLGAGESRRPGLKIPRWHAVIVLAKQPSAPGRSLRDAFVPLAPRGVGVRGAGLR